MAIEVIKGRATPGPPPFAGEFSPYRNVRCFRTCRIQDCNSGDLFDKVLGLFGLEPGLKGLSGKLRSFAPEGILKLQEQLVGGTAHANNRLPLSIAG